MESGRHGDCPLFLHSSVERLRWFLLPSEAASSLTNPMKTTPTATHPFQPHRYSGGIHPDMEPGPRNGIKTEHQNDTEIDQSCAMPEEGGVPESVPVADSGLEWRPKFHHPPKAILNPTIEVKSYQN